MKIGIPFQASSTAFGSGKAQAVLAMANVCVKAGHDVTLLYEGDRSWWEDVQGLEAQYTIRPLTKERLCDLVIDIDGKLDPDLRTAVGGRVIVFFRSDPSFEYLEASASMGQAQPYSLQGVHEVWVWDLMVGLERIPLLQTMMEALPVRRVPYVWTSVLLKQYLEKEALGTKALQTQTPIAWNVFISEKNTTNTSSCLIPLLASSKACNVGEIILFNAKQLQTNLFFQHNLIQNGANFKTKQALYEGRMRYADWIQEPNCLCVSHLRHTPFRPGLLDLFWLGLPIVHNSALFQQLGSYYSENDIEGLVQAIQTFSIDQFSQSRDSTRAFVENEWSIEKGLGGWTKALQEIQALKAPLRIVFTDMWEGFQAKDNFFLDLLRSVQTDRSVEGVEEGNCDLVICGPFGTKWQSPSYQGCPKVYYSGEPPMLNECQDSRIDLFLTHSPVESERQMRLPIWTLFVEWFGQPSSPHRNPNRLPQELLLKPIQAERTNFCAFVVSNPLSEERNQAFERVNAYKHVNSGGSYKNTIGGPLPALYAGGGSGDQAKVEFYKSHLFCLCYENCVAPGYVTEKLLHAKMAGCVPLYRGSLNAIQDFDPNGFVYVQDGQDVVQLIQALEADPRRLAEIATTPALDQDRYLATISRLNHLGQRLLNLAIRPRKPINEVVQIVLPTQVKRASPLFATFATQSYISSATLAIQSVETLRKKDPAIGMRLYVGQDVSEKAIETLDERFPWLQIQHLPAPPESFPEMFKPSMFGWKPWLLHDLCHDPVLDGQVIVYADAGSTWIAMPDDMLTVVQQAGVCLIKDRSQINRHWCSESMVQEMGVSPQELEQHQLMAGFVGFRANHPSANRLFDEALKWASKQSVLFGPYCAGIGADGKPFGHRHDQSILSILSSRQNTPTLDSVRFVCASTLRKAYQKSTPVYLHRGNPVNHVQVIPGIDDVWVISLDRRPDRWQSLMTAHPELLPIANRLPGIDGKMLSMTPGIAGLFAKNDFKWKKSVTGCALSHILTWAQLASEHPAVQSYLILEDDCRFIKTIGWKEQIAAAVAKAPPDAELLMLGGVLPSNVPLYPSFLDPINDTWATILPNNLFTGKDQIPFFHFCAYSYILTKAGAKKLLSALQTKGVYTSIDHYLIHPNQGLRTYVLKDLITTCFQAEDPVYKTASFDEFLRVDSYDSDIWNNNDCFEKPVIPFEIPSLWQVLVDVLSQAPHSIQTRNTIREEVINGPSPSTVYYCPDSDRKLDATMEEGWLRSLWPSIRYAPFPGIDALPPNAWLLVARPVLEFWQEACRRLNIASKPFNILHLSDEGCLDPIEFYNYPCCKKVIRNYSRANLNEKVRVMPLGYAVKAPICPSPSFKDRPMVWGFHGSSWSNREELLKPLLSIGPNNYKMIQEFQGKDMSSPQEYQQMLLQSQCVPIPRGNHVETFRLYEALEHGAVPLYVRTADRSDEVYWPWLRSHLHLMEIASWDKVPVILELFRKFPEKAEQYRTGLLDQWARWKAECKTYFP